MDGFLKRIKLNALLSAALYALFGLVLLILARPLYQGAVYGSWRRTAAVRRGRWISVPAAPQGGHLVRHRPSDGRHHPGGIGSMAAGAAHAADHRHPQDHGAFDLCPWHIRLWRRHDATEKRLSPLGNGYRPGAFDLRAGAGAGHFPPSVPLPQWCGSSADF